MGDEDLEKFRQQWRKEITDCNHTNGGNATGFTCGERSSKKQRKWGRGPGYHGDSEAGGEPRAPRPGREDGDGSKGERQPMPAGDYFYLAESLLEGRTSPLRDRIESGRCGGSGVAVVGRKGTGKAAGACDSSPGRAAQPPSCSSSKRENLLDQLINDLNEMNEIPFFDIDLPYELALKIFAYLGKTELGRCAQVSKAWKVIAEDEVLWYKHCLKEGYQTKANIGDLICWKAVLRDSMKKEQTLQANWKFSHSPPPSVDISLRCGSTEPTTQLYLAQMTSLFISIDIKAAFLQGDTVQREVFLKPPKEETDAEGKLWKLNKCVCGLNAASRVGYFSNRIGAASQLQYDVGGILCDAHSCNGMVVAGYTSGDVRMWDISTWDSSALYLETSHSSAELGPRPHVSFVRINSTIAVAAYKGGAVDVWSTVLAQEPVHHYQHSQEIHAIAIGSDNAAVATSSGCQVRLESSDERGYWRKAYQFELQKLVSYLQLIPGALNTDENQPLVAAAEDTVYLLNPYTEPKVLHSIYGNTVTCLDVSINRVACGVKSFGWIMSHGNKVQVYCLQTAQPLATLGNSAGDFTCVNLKDSPPHLAVTGNKDRKVRVYDLRTSKEVISLYGHQLGVSSVQMDDWKIVSGGEEGLVCVWEQRMGTKLWEMHSRHPVRHLRFAAQTLVTANIPDEKCPRGASIMDDDLTAHRRHRGIIYVYDFSIDKSAPVLPICCSSYDEDVGYSYNIALSMPYDQIK
ncbi:F-box/WD repeat-containing protein 8 isoform X2 [Heterodontus francisci]|uniref:F-box/WD repeat-containing protein 8 isoform X2 n=1 Tax=Heterodontus francisci TaxID=7792 RepID=UPI00355B4F3E